MPNAPYGPIGGFSADSLDKHGHWDLHGIYKVEGPVNGAWADLWKHDDAMFHSEMGCPSASPAEIIRRYKGDLDPMPATHANALWNRQSWWNAVADAGRLPGFTGNAGKCR